MTYNITAVGIQIENRLYKAAYEPDSDNMATFNGLFTRCDIVVDLTTRYFIRNRYTTAETLSETNPLFSMLMTLPLMTLKDVQKIESLLINSHLVNQS